MISDGSIALPVQCICQCKRQVCGLLSALCQADRKSCPRVKSCQILKFPARCTCKMKRRIKVFKHKSLCGHFVEGGRKLRVYHIPAEALRCDKDHIVPLKHARILVLLCRLHTSEIFTEPSLFIAGRRLCQSFKINIHLIVIIHRLLRLCRRLLHLGHRLPGSPEYAVADILQQHGPKAKLFYLVVCIKVCPGQIGRVDIPFPGQKKDRRQTGGIKNTCRPKCQDRLFPFCPFLFFPVAVCLSINVSLSGIFLRLPCRQEICAQRQHHHKKDTRDVLRQGCPHSRTVVSQVIAGGGLQPSYDLIILLEDHFTDALRHIDHCHQKRDDGSHSPPDLPGQK